MILLNDFKRQWQEVGEEATRAFQTVGASGWYILGSEVEAFETSLAKYFKRDYAVGVASGLDAIEIALRVLGCGPGCRVLTTPLSAFATTLAILKTGGVPVFVDCDCDGLIDLNQVRQVLRERNDIRFLVPVHLYGHCLDEEALKSLVQDFDIIVVEDCAQSIGVSAGNVGRIAATSFYPTKNLGAMGDGGALVTDDPGLAERARQIRDYGQTAKYRHDVAGMNSRLDELQAAILHRVCLPRLNGWVARRQEIATRYTEGMRNPAVRLLAPPLQSSWHLFPTAVESKGDFKTHLQARGILSGEHYPVAIPDQGALADLPYETLGHLPVARDLCQSEVSLPIHPYLTEDEVDRVIEAVNEWRA